MTDLQVKLNSCCRQHGFAAMIVLDRVVVYAVAGAKTPADAMKALDLGFAALRDREMPTEILAVALEHRVHILSVIRRMREME